MKGPAERALFEHNLNHPENEVELSFVGLVQQLVDTVNNLFRRHIAPSSRVAGVNSGKAVASAYAPCHKIASYSLMSVPVHIF